MVGATKGITFGDAPVAEIEKQENHYLVKVMMDRTVSRDVIHRNML
jgi:hypothetical protein